MNTEFRNSGKILRFLHSHSPLKKKKKIKKTTAKKQPPDQVLTKHHFLFQ